jgi:HK97 family phage prohead protease
MATLSGAERDNLPDSDFAFIEPGGSKDSSGRTTPRKLRHYPIHDEAHVRAALSRIGQGDAFAEQARGKVMAKARSMGIEHDGDGDGRSQAASDVERRFIGAHARSSWQIGEYRLETRSSDDGPHIHGYAAVFNRQSKNLGGFRERVTPAASRRAQLEGFPGVLCRYNHNENLLLGTIQARTLVMQPDNVGVHYDVRPPQSRSDIVELVDRGDVAHSSFAFRCVEDDWGMDETGYPERRLLDIDWVDVAPVVTPAYGDSTAGLRSLARRFDASEDEVRSLAGENELRRFFVRTDNRGPAQSKPKVMAAAAHLAVMGKRDSPFVDSL